MCALAHFYETLHVIRNSFCYRQPGIAYTLKNNFYAPPLFGYLRSEVNYVVVYGFERLSRRLQQKVYSFNINAEPINTILSFGTCLVSHCYELPLNQFPLF